MSYEVVAVEYFRRRLKKLSKKYRGIGEVEKSDRTEVVKRLLSDK